MRECTVTVDHLQVSLHTPFGANLARAYGSSAAMKAYIVKRGKLVSEVPPVGQEVDVRAVQQWL